MDKFEKKYAVCGLFLGMVALTGLAADRGIQKSTKPNILIIVADDMGFSDAGCYGSEIQTPNLDRLAANGLRFTQFYNTARCWPSRSSLLTGYYAQAIRRDGLAGETGVRAGGNGVRPRWAQLLPVLLKPQGYRSYHSGKWHVDGNPLGNGFDHSYLLDDHDNYFTPKLHSEDNRKLPGIASGQKFYTTSFIADEAITFLKEHAAKYSSQPFFEYLAFTSPHFPIQALPEDIAFYKGRYSSGWDAIRAERLARMEKLGILACALSPLEPGKVPGWNLKESELRKQIGPNEVGHAVPWESLTDGQKKFQASKMEVHAAMVHRMDLEIGRVLGQIKAMGALENTLVFFLSDNGASAEQIIRGEGHNPSAPVGSEETFLGIGPGWSSTANTPFRLHKSWTHEGGITTPLIVSWPANIKAHNELRTDPGHLIDLVPTVLELTGVKQPATMAGLPVPPLHGKSLVSAFSRDGSVTRESLWWNHIGNRAIRMGDWKLAACDNTPWELYDLSKDRSEINNLAATYPEKVKEMAAVWMRQAGEFHALALQDQPSAQLNTKGGKKQVAAESAPTAQLPTDFQITLGGEVGDAAEANMARFRSSPFDSVAWLRADLTGETAAEFNKIMDGGMPFRPFKEYSGDISGRFIEIMALNAQGSPVMNPAFLELLKEVPKHQRVGGYFCASGEINWQQPIDRNSNGESIAMMPALWGNARILCGLVEACRIFPENKEILATVKKLGDFYANIAPRFTDPARMTEYISGTSYASGYVTCWFPAMEGLVKLSTLTGDKKYLDAAMAIAKFYKSIDRIPLDHSHGMLCCQVSLLLLFEATKDASYLERVEKRWDELVQGGYINPAGGILEKCQVVDGRDEGCAEADWLRLNLELGRVTQKSRYWDMAERHLNNQFLQNQAANGGFGHHNIFTDKDGVRGFGGNVLEATWCCDYHGQIGFLNLRSHLLERNAAGLTCNLALEFTAKEAAGSVKSILSAGTSAGEVMRQRIQLNGLPASVVRIRQPQWADSVTAVAADGSALLLIAKNGYCATKDPVTSVEFVYAGGVYAEGRRCNRLANGPVDGQPFALGFGPKLFAAANQTITLPAWPTTVDALKAQGITPFSPALRGKDYRFVFDRK